MPKNDDTSILPEENKNIREELYKRNLELAKLYKQVGSLNNDLATANFNLKELIKQRESLVHLITHKVKGSFTRTKFIFAGLLDGTFGDINPDVKKVAQQGLDFDNGGIQTVDLVLNVANLQNGLIKYDMKPIDFKDVVEKTVEDKRLGVEAKGLRMEMNIKEGRYETTGDAFWLKEVVNNLIENSIKYTREGTIIVGLENKSDKILLSVKDTGLGITEEDKHNLFTEGGRGKDSIKVNVDSTGYGLFTVKMVVEAHRGKVWGESEGPNKGSQFYVELPILK
jgi:signal transduction histidine kinase